MLGIDFAALAPVPDFALPGAIGVDRLPYPLVELGRVPARTQHQGHLADHVGGDKAGQFLEGQIDRLDGARTVHHHHRFRCVFADSFLQPKLIDQPALSAPYSVAAPEEDKGKGSPLAAPEHG